MKIITACAKIIKVFSTKIIIICAAWESVLKHAWRNEMSVSFLIFLLATCVWTFNSGNFNPSEMCKMCIFVKNAFLFVLFTMIVKNVAPLFSFSSIYLEIKLVISNHFGIVRLKTQSEKYMALKDEGVMWLRYMPQRLQT